MGCRAIDRWMDGWMERRTDRQRDKQIDRYSLVLPCPLAVYQYESSWSLSSGSTHRYMETIQG
jgi:hypothetical protein